MENKTILSFPLIQISSEKKQEIREDAQKMLEPIIPILEQFFEKHKGFVSNYKSMSFFKHILCDEVNGEVVTDYDDLALVIDLVQDNGSVRVLKNS